jgi:hypothetical protein
LHRQYTPQLHPGEECGHSRIEAKRRQHGIVPEVGKREGVPIVKTAVEPMERLIQIAKTGASRQHFVKDEPRLKMSDRASTAVPRACSGDM